MHPTVRPLARALLGILLVSSLAAAAPVKRIYSLAGGAGGIGPLGLVFAPSGSVFGVTADGGIGSCAEFGPGCGTVFELQRPSPPRTAWSFRTIWRFSGPNGSAPLSLALDGAGNLYGATEYGGDLTKNQGLGCGTVFQLSPPGEGGGAWHEKVLHVFSCGADGMEANGIVRAASGVLYGTTYSGGDLSCSNFEQPAGCGVVFALTPPGPGKTAWPLTILHAFAGNAPDGLSDGSYPEAQPLIGSDGSLYGATSSNALPAGSGGPGTVFRLTPPAAGQKGWTETILHRFAGSPSDGAYPGWSPLQDGSGALIGTTEQGGGYCAGINGCGVVYKLTPPSPPATLWTETILLNVSVRRQSNPSATLSPGGTIYLIGDGSGWDGSIYALSPPAVPGGAWTDTPLHLFKGAPDGNFPNGPVVPDPLTPGTYLGTTGLGGAYNEGLIYSITP